MWETLFLFPFQRWGNWSWEELVSQRRKRNKKLNPYMFYSRKQALTAHSTLTMKCFLLCEWSDSLLPSSHPAVLHVIKLCQLCWCHWTVVSFDKGSRVTACVYIRILRVLFGWYASSWIKVWDETVLEPVFCAQERCALLSNLLILLKKDYSLFTLHMEKYLDFGRA